MYSARGKNAGKIFYEECGCLQGFWLLEACAASFQVWTRIAYYGNFIILLKWLNIRTDLAYLRDPNGINRFWKLARVSWKYRQGSSTFHLLSWTNWLSPYTSEQSYFSHSSFVLWPNLSGSFYNGDKSNYNTSQHCCCLSCCRCCTGIPWVKTGNWLHAFRECTGSVGLLLLTEIAKIFHSNRLTLQISVYVVIGTKAAIFGRRFCYGYPSKTLIS